MDSSMNDILPDCATLYSLYMHDRKGGYYRFVNAKKA